MNIDKKHSLDKEDALARMQALTNYWKKHGINAQWDGDRTSISGKIKGFSFKGTLEVRSDHVHATVEANFLARKAGGAYVERKLKDYLDPKNSLEDLKARG
ncbi:MAG: polyhydroxyalkanoic acid system family protein [Deltaproteobacteria bacterium]|nr:polyhydroxyalkanoic acid system family protein [Deltaproteobacteria bacterium]